MPSPLLLLRWLVKLTFPLSLIAFPAVAVFGQFNAWPPASEALAAHQNQTPVMVGFSYRFTHSLTSSMREVKRSYVLFPSVLRSGTIVSVSQRNGGTPVVKESERAFFYLVAWYVVCIFGTWWFWFRRVATQRSVPADVAASRRRG